MKTYRYGDWLLVGDKPAGFPFELVGGRHPRVVANDEGTAIWRSRLTGRTYEMPLPFAGHRWVHIKSTAGRDALAAAA